MMNSVYNVGSYLVITIIHLSGVLSNLLFPWYWIVALFSFVFVLSNRLGLWKFQEKQLRDNDKPELVVFLSFVNYVLVSALYASAWFLGVPFLLTRDNKPRVAEDQTS